MTFGAHKLVYYEPFMNFDNCCQRYIATCGKKFIFFNLYSLAITFSALNNCGGIFFQSLSYLYEVVRTNFPPIFVLVAICYRNFAKTVVPPSDEYENYVVLLKEQSLVKKKLQTTSKSVDKRQRNPCSNYARLERTVLLIRSVTNKQNKKLS